MFWIFPKYWVKQDMNHESLPPKIKHKFQEVPKSKGKTSKYLIKYFNNSTQPKPACYLTFFNTRPKPHIEKALPVGPCLEIPAFFFPEADCSSVARRPLRSFFPVFFFLLLFPLPPPLNPSAPAIIFFSANFFYFEVVLKFCGRHSVFISVCESRH